MRITTLIQKGVLIVRITGELDMHVANQFRDTIDQCLEQSGLNDIVINLEEVPFIDSSGIGVILGRYKKVAHLGGKVSLVGVQSAVEKILLLSGILGIMKLYENENKALACF